MDRGVLASKAREAGQEVIEQEYPDLSEKIEVLEFEQGELIMKVTNTSLVQELKLEEQKIVKKINQKLDQTEVKNITFRSK